MALGEWVPNQRLIDHSRTFAQNCAALAQRLGIHFANAGDWNIPLAYDGVHFTQEGHRVLAAGLLNVLSTLPFRKGIVFLFKTPYNGHKIHHKGWITIMARVSTKENKNIYHKTREALHLTREAASELLESIAPERIERIENERCYPHPDEVLIMARQYKQPNLCNYY